MPHRVTHSLRNARCGVSRGHVCKCGSRVQPQAQRNGDVRGLMFNSQRNHLAAPPSDSEIDRRSPA
eukprot:scaffold40574_cov27-Tisochrysis_lutea.AAC.21